MLRHLLAALAPAGRRGRLSILIFHRVVPSPDPLFPGEVDAARFDAICGWLRQWYQVMPLDHAAQALREHRLPARALAITFDDGYADNHDVALPILQRHGLTATFFVATGYLDGGCMWNDVVIEAVRHTERTEADLSALQLPQLQMVALATPAQRRVAIDQLIGPLKYLEQGQRDEAAVRLAALLRSTVPTTLMMSSAQVAALHRAEMGVGAHTVSHPILRRLPKAQARQEIEAGKAQLEAIVQAPVRLFAYPNGRPDEDYSAREVALVRRAGFDAAVCTAWGSAGQEADLFQLPRFTPWDRGRMRFGLRSALNLRAVGRTCAGGAASAAPADAGAPIASRP